MGTDRFKEDVSEALKKFLKKQSDQTPKLLRVNYQDAMGWHTAELSEQLIETFVNQEVRSYLDSIPFQKSALRCSIELLGEDDGTPTRFE